MRFWCLSSLVVAALAALVAQEPEARPGRPIFRVSSTLATIDAVVIDDDGHHVTDLTKDDFQVTVGSKRQELQHVVYVRAGSPPVTVSVIAQSLVQTDAWLPPVPQQSSSAPASGPTRSPVRSRSSSTT